MEGASALSSVFEPVQPPTTFEETVERLGTAIRLGLLTPGVQLPPERELAEQLGIARSTLRQALTTLVQSGHLVAHRGRGGGTFVAERPPLRGPTEGLRPDWRQVLDLRIAIECGAAVLAADRRDSACLAQMEESIADMDAAADFDAYRRADVRFHIALAEATGTPRVIAAMTEIQGEMTDLIAPLAHPTEVMVHSNDDHRRLVAALHEGDAASAVMILRAHLRGAEHIIAGLAPPPG
jgi:GntR family transcriptional regulator, transcriptional repressor for pyruvate dehydrogenase complex